MITGRQTGRNVDREILRSGRRKVGRTLFSEEIRKKSKDRRIANCDGIRTFDNYLNELHDCSFPFLQFPKHHNSPPVAFLDCRVFVPFFWLACVRGCIERERERESVCVCVLYIVCVYKRNGKFHNYRTSYGECVARVFYKAQERGLVAAAAGASAEEE
jgi:hypothetical protein